MVLRICLAKIEPIDFGIAREEDLRGALDINEDNTSSENVDLREKNKKMQDKLDYQLSRALDLIRGAAVFRDLKS